MSRPPRPFPERAVGATRHPLSGPLRYLPLEHADFVAMQRSLHEGAFGRVPEEADGEPTGTLFDLAATLAHVLARYQDFYASEAFLTSASTGRALVRHARRLAYTADPGLSALGYAALTIHKNQSGTVEAGLAIASAPAGTRAAQDYVSTAERVVSAAWNEIGVVGAESAISLGGAVSSLVLQGVGLGVRVGQPALLVGPAKAWPLRVQAVTEDRALGRTTLQLAASIAVNDVVSAWDPSDPTAGWRVVYEPTVTLRAFGWGADPVSWPDAALTATASVTVSGVTFSWVAPTGIGGTDLFAVPAPGADLVGGWLYAEPSAGAAAWRVDTATPTSFALQATSTYDTFVPDPTDTDYSDGVTLVPDTATTTSRLVATGVELGLVDASGSPVSRGALGRAGVAHGGWARFAPLVDTYATATTVSGSGGLDLDGDHTGLTRGMLVALSTLDGATTQVVRLETVAGTPEDAPTTTRITWTAVSPATPIAFTLGDLVVHGNVVPIAHGALKSEVLGGSDGTTPFQRYALKKSPLSHDAGADGAEPVVTVTVSDVTWSRVADFADSGPADRHYRVQVDADGSAWVCFGDGRQGAVPPAGRKNIAVTYRVGLGEAANVEAGAASRLGRAHALVQRVTNPVALAGGTEPADPEGIRTAAPLYLRTFDRAVSVTDHAELALTYPGVYRAAARWDEVEGVQLVAATSTGAALADPPALKAFLDARRDTSVPLTLKTPVTATAYVLLSLEVASGYARADVEDALTAALVDGLFSFSARALGQPAHLSEVYAAVVDVEGVAFVEVAEFGWTEGAATVADVLTVEPWQWIVAQVAFVAEGS